MDAAEPGGSCEFTIGSASPGRTRAKRPPSKDLSLRGALAEPLSKRAKVTAMSQCAIAQRQVATPQACGSSCVPSSKTPRTPRIVSVCPSPAIGLLGAAMSMRQDVEMSLVATPSRQSMQTSVPCTPRQDSSRCGMGLCAAAERSTPRAASSQNAVNSATTHTTPSRGGLLATVEEIRSRSARR